MSNRFKQKDVSKRIGVFLAFLTVVLGSGFFANPNRAYAGDECSDLERYAVTIMGDTVTKDLEVGDTVDWNFETATLTLTNYKNNPICISAGDDEQYRVLTIKLVGENEIFDNSDYDGGVDGIEIDHGFDVVVFQGGETDKLDMTFLQRGGRLVSAYTFIEGGNINLYNESGKVDEKRCEMYIHNMSGGNVYSECTINTSEGGPFYQSGGNLEVKGKEGSDYCFEALYPIFDGGTTNIDCSDGVGIWAWSVPEMKEYFIEEYGVTKEDEDIVWVSPEGFAELGVVYLFPKEDSAILFRKGDVTIKSTSLAVAAEAEIDEPEAYVEGKAKDFMIKVAEGLETERLEGDTTPDAPIVIDFVAVNDRGQVDSFFTDGEEIVWDFEEEDYPQNVVKGIHIYKPAPEPDPEPDPSPAPTPEPEEEKTIIIEGADQTLTIGEGKDLVIRYSRDVEFFEKVEIDGKEVPEGSFTVKSGSTILSIKADYLKDLKAGEHKILAYFEGEDDPVETTFTLKAKNGDQGLFTSEGQSLETTIFIGFILSALSVLAVYYHATKKAKKNLDEKYF